MDCIELFYTNLEITKCNSWKMASIRPFLAGDEIAENINSPPCMIEPEESLEHEELGDTVEGEQELDEQVERADVASTGEAAHSSHLIRYSRRI